MPDNMVKTSTTTTRAKRAPFNLTFSNFNFLGHCSHQFFQIFKKYSESKWTLSTIEKILILIKIIGGCIFESSQVDSSLT